MSDPMKDWQPAEEQRPEQAGGTPSTAENTSFETGAGVRGTGYDSPPTTSSDISNTEISQAGEYPADGGQAEPHDLSNHP